MTVEHRYPVALERVPDVDGVIVVAGKQNPTCCGNNYVIYGEKVYEMEIKFLPSQFDLF